MEEAPLRSDLAEGPEGGRAVWAPADDGVRLRTGGWPAGQNGTVLLFTGRTEYIEKYGRMARSFAKSGLSTFAIDWRGQGFADRVAADPALGHVHHFSDYQRDVAAFLAAARHLGMPEPYHLLGHSMGGAIGLRALVQGLPVQTAVFSAPMWGIAFPGWLDAVSGLVADAARVMNLGLQFAPGTGPVPYPVKQPFEGNELTTDPESYDWLRAHIEADTRFGLGGPSMNWLRESLSDIRELHKITEVPCPTLVLLGSREAIVASDKVRTLTAQLANARLEMIEGARHEAMMELPEIRADFTRRAIAQFEQR